MPTRPMPEAARYPHGFVRQDLTGHRIDPDYPDCCRCGLRLIDCPTYIAMNRTLRAPFEGKPPEEPSHAH